MPKIDPNGEVPNPIRAKLAGDIARPMPSAEVNENIVALPVRKQPEPSMSEAPATDAPPSTKLAKPKKVLFTVLEQAENDSVVRQLGAAIGTDTLGWSHVNRALWSLLRRAQDHIGERRSLAPKLTRPSNGNPIEMARFEDALSEYLLALFKDMPRNSF